MTRVRILFVAIGVGALGVALAPDEARACSLVGNEPLVTDPGEETADTTPPGAPAVEVTVDPGPDESGCMGSNSCDGTGTIWLEVSGTDDRTPREQLGYQVTLASGELPATLSLPVEPV